MKKRIFAFALALVTLLAMFALAACKGGNKDNGNDGDDGGYVPEPIDGLTLIVGKWKIDQIEIVPSGEGGGAEEPPFELSNYSLEIFEEGAFALYAYDGEDHTYNGTATNGIALNYYEFTCTMGEITVTASAYLYPDGNTLSFTSIAFTGGDVYTNYSSCTCVRGY